MEKKIKSRMCNKSDTASNWTTNNPILLKGEVGYESDTNKFKIGDGTTSWTELKYQIGLGFNNGAEIFNDYENNVSLGEYSHVEGMSTKTSRKAYSVINKDATAKTYTLSSVDNLSINDRVYLESANWTLSFGKIIQIDPNNNIVTVDNFQDCEIGDHFYIDDITVGDVDIGLPGGHSEGCRTSAAGRISHAEGLDTVASGNISHSEGNSSIASGACAHAEGFQNVASGSYSHAEGGANVVSGVGAHAEGQSTTASGNQAHSEGAYTKALGEESHAEGHYTISSKKNQHVQGKFNIEDTDNSTQYGKYAHIVGNGTSNTARSNAHTLDWNGNAWYQGNITVGGTYNSETKTVDGAKELVNEEVIERIKYYDDPNIIPSDESYFTVNSTGETITGLTDEGKTNLSGTVIIPYKINGVEITTLNSNLQYGTSIFNGATDKITTVILPNSVTNIERFAFESCNLLSSINIPNSVMTIGTGAFYKCTSLTSINISNSITRISSNAFDGCSSLASINIPNSVTSIGDYAFKGCSSLTKIEIPNSVTSIEMAGFVNCTSLISVILPNSVTSISGYIFAGCTSLKSITIPNSVTSIETSAFNNCINLTIYCEQGSYAETYANTNNISVVYTDVKDMATETELERLKYYGDKDIIPSDESYFTVNETGETITGLTDAGKTQTELVIPYKINGIEILYLGSDSWTSILSSNNVITKVVIPNSVTSILKGAFAGCTSLTSINIPNSVTVISASTFASCTSLTSINIPNSVTVIALSAFYNCTSLTSVKIPNSVTSINDGFEGCTNLTIYCEQGSYAETYANNNGIPVMYTDISKSDFDNKADKATTLEGYGITDVYTKVETDTKLDTKANFSDLPTKVSDLENDSGFITTVPETQTSITNPIIVNTIYDLGLQTNISLTLPAGQLGNFIQVDFVSGPTATSLTVSSIDGIIGYNLIPEANNIYTLYFDWGVIACDTIGVQTYGWRCNYFEYAITLSEPSST